MPCYQQIARQLKNAIEKGELTPGTRLPSSRAWAQELGVSRSTMENAYAELVAQGWFARRGQAGTFVSEQLRPGRASASPAISAGENPRSQPFQMELPALDLFPREVWTRVTGRRLRTQTRLDLAVGDVCGERVLRRAIADYLRVSRSIECQPEQIFVTLGYAAPMTLILRTLAHPGEGMWVEGLSFPLIRPVVAQERIELMPVAMDADGLDVSAGIRDYPQACFVLLTPAHQSPLGVALPLDRRHQLLERATRTQAWVIEGDYDSEFRYHGRPLPLLKSLDAPQRVIYAGTFSKSMFLALRTVWLVVPPIRVEYFRRQATLTACSVPVLWQQTLADFMQNGHFWRYLKRMRQYYAERRQWMENALTKQGLSIIPQEGGIQLVMSMDGDDIALVHRANQAGLAVQALSRWRITSEGKGGILLSFINISSAEMAQQAAYQLRLALT